jgi:hypothetical protein
MSERTPPRVLALMLCFLGLFVLVGTGLLLYGRRQLNLARAAESWPTVEAVIVSSELVVEDDTVSEDETVETYGADIVFTYTIDGVSYRSGRVSFGSYRSSDIGHAYAIIERYPVGATVAAHYDPADPSSAVLEPGYAAGITLFFVVGGLFAGAGSILFIMTVVSEVRSG